MREGERSTPIEKQQDRARQKCRARQRDGEKHTERDRRRGEIPAAPSLPHPLHTPPTTAPPPPIPVPPPSAAPRPPPTCPREPPKAVGDLRQPPHPPPPRTQSLLRARRDPQPALFRNFTILSIPNCFVSDVVDNLPLPTFPDPFAFPVRHNPFMPENQFSRGASFPNKPVNQSSQGQSFGNLSITYDS